MSVSSVGSSSASWRRRLAARCALAVAALTAAVTAAMPAAAAGPANELVRRGEYLANAGDCIACHTAPGGKPLAGGGFLDTPFGAISTPNITPDKATGIGSWTDDEFVKLMHDGIDKHGNALYPAMPFPWYASVSRDDVLAIKAYLFAQAPVQQQRPPSRLRFPYNQRAVAMLAWRTAFFRPAPFKPDPAQTDEVNRGSYLVNGLAHCGECHNARPVAGTSKWRQSLQGGVVGNWYAPNITSDVRDGIGAWSTDEIATYLKTGSAPGKGIALGPMAEAVHSLSHLTDGDLHAIAAYLKSTPAKSTEPAQTYALFKGGDARGGNTYLNFCASCHGVDGKGVQGVVPPLADNGAVTAKGPQNVISVVLGGLPAKQGYAPMIAIGAGMSDEDVADVANYVRQTWNNAAPPTATAGMVAELRKSTTSAMNGAPGSDCPPITPKPLAAAIADPRSGLQQQLASVTEADMSTRVTRIVATARTKAPGTAKADLVNGLTAAYCAVVRADAALDVDQKALQLGQFSQLVYSVSTSRTALR